MNQFDADYLAHEYFLARQRIVGLLEGRSREVADLPVQTCPDWNVHDLMAHVSGLAAEIVKGNPPGSDSQAWVDAIIDARRGVDLDGLLEEWSIVGPVFEEMAAQTRRLSVPLSYDTVVHEHDLRHAIGAPGARDSSGVMAAMEVGVWLMTNDLDRRQFGRVNLRAGGRDWSCGSGEVRLGLDLDAAQVSATPVWELLRVTGSRRSHAQAKALPWTGDFERGLAAMLHMELPVDDIHE
ncbi:MAG: hypothetical protein FJW44_05320 [Actinobacteria bacterium]|nr:hypothetical protein [Actinomycetota bacterium]